MDARRDQLLGDAPLEHPDDPPDPAVDLGAAIASPDHLVAHGFERQWPEGVRGYRPVQPADDAEHEADIARLDGRATILHVIPVDEPGIGQDQLVDGQSPARFGTGGGTRRGWMAGVNFGEEAMISLPALRRIKLAEIVSMAVDDDHPKVLRLVVAVLRGTATEHECSLPAAESVTGNALHQPRKPHPPTRRGILNPGFGVSWNEWSGRGSNPQPQHCERCALPIELPPLVCEMFSD